MSEMNYELFRNPDKSYREVPFWSWNDDLDPDELRRQIALMDEAGWGGFFMHAREGLRTPYLGRRWMACVRACVEEAGKRSMGAWLYDEDRWPSGFAGGLSVAPDPSCRLQALVCKVDNKPALISERTATFIAREAEGRLRDLRPVDAGENVRLEEESARIVQFYVRTMPLGSRRFNDYCYLSLLNPDAVRAFLDSTHQAYAREFARLFGGTMPGIFTDEPCIYLHASVPWSTDLPQMSLPWCVGFEAYFRRLNGYDLLPHLPALFFDADVTWQAPARSFHQVRYDYWRTVTQRFVESYSRQVYEWCEDHGLLYTGHYMGEDTLLSQVRWVGAVMPHYEYMHIPGVDRLGRRVNVWAGTVLTMKQLDSVVCQLGKRRAMCENYGCAGQELAHAGRKWIGDWASVLGITLHTPHLALYSMRGARKRDYPPNLFYQQPWWPENRLVADYFARLSYALSQGRRVVDILVIHPIGSAWAVYRPDATHAVDQLDRALNDLCMTLMRHQRDFHFGDEMLMEEHAGVELEDDQSAMLRVGQMLYRVVILPPGVTLAANTVHLLRQFAEAGGTVLALEPTPALVNGRVADGPILPESTRIITLAELPATLDAVLPFDVRIPHRPAIWVHHRRQGQADWYFLANTDPERGGPATVWLRGSGRLEAWDPATGDAVQLPHTQHEGIIEIALDFPPAGSCLLVRDNGIPPVATQPSTWEHPAGEIPLDQEWRLALAGPNALTLDMVQLRLGEGKWSSPMYVLDAHRQIAEAGPGTPFDLRFTFDVAVCPAGPVHLIVESPERFAISANGQPVAGIDKGWWVDTSFRKVDVTSLVHSGLNEVLLSGVFRTDTELESIYLIGDFAVAAEKLGEEQHGGLGQTFHRYAPRFRVTTLPSTVGGRGEVDLTEAGLPFFAGRVVLAQTIALSAPAGRFVLVFDELRAALAHVRVNGRRAGMVAWPPYRVDVSGLLRSGDNEIEIELVNTLRNLLGPHHFKGGAPDCTGPREFHHKAHWTDDYILASFGFTGARLIES